MADENQKPEENQEPVNAKATEPEAGPLEKAWNSRALSAVRIPYKVARAATSPYWWPAKKITQGLWNVNKPLGAAFGLAATGVAVGALTYGAALGWVKFNDTTSFLNWPATQGEWHGKITRFSEKGIWPCNSYEGNLRTGEAADSQLFAVRKWDKELIEAIQTRPQGVDVTLVYRDNGLPQEAFGEQVRTQAGEFDKVDPTWIYGCIQHSNHTAVGLHYQHNGQEVSVGVRPEN